MLIAAEVFVNREGNRGVFLLELNSRAAGECLMISDWQLNRPALYNLFGEMAANRMKLADDSDSSSFRCDRPRHVREIMMHLDRQFVCCR